MLSFLQKIQTIFNIEMGGLSCFLPEISDVWSFLIKMMIPFLVILLITVVISLNKLISPIISPKLQIVKNKFINCLNLKKNDSENDYSTYLVMSDPQMIVSTYKNSSSEDLLNRDNDGFISLDDNSNFFSSNKGERARTLVFRISLFIFYVSYFQVFF